MLKSYRLEHLVKVLFLLVVISFYKSDLRAEVGVSSSEILIGQSVPLSGAAAAVGKQINEGVRIHFKSVNDTGGVNGRKLELIVLDDGYAPAKSADNTRILASDNEVFALTSYYGTQAGLAVLPALEKEKIPLIGIVSGAPALREPVNRYLFNVQSSLFNETEAIANQLLILGLKNIAVFYQNDEDGKAGLIGVQRALQKRKVTPIALGMVEKNGSNVEEATKAIAKANPQAVIIIALPKWAGVFIKGMKDALQNPLFIGTSTLPPGVMYQELGEASRGVGVTQVVPDPTSQAKAIVKEYQKALGKYSKEKPSSLGLQGFINAKILVEGIKRSGKDLTREKLISSLESMSDYNLGGFSVSYSSTSHAGSGFVELGIIGSNGVVRY